MLIKVLCQNHFPILLVGGGSLVHGLLLLSLKICGLRLKVSKASLMAGGKTLRSRVPVAMWCQRNLKLLSLSLKVGIRKCMGESRYEKTSPVEPG